MTCRLLLSRRDLLLKTAYIAPVPFGRIAWAAAGGPMIADARHRSVAMGKAQAIACIGGVITEILYRLGASSRICAVDDTSSWPKEALTSKAHLGYMRTISAEGVLSTHPDLILAMNDAGPPEALSSLEESIIPLLYVDATATPQAALQRVTSLAKVVGAEAEGAALQSELAQGYSNVAQAAARARARRQRVLFILHVSNRRLICAGSGTPADNVINLCRAINVASGIKGYKMLSPEALAVLQPDAIITMRENGVHVSDILRQDAGLQTTPAGRRNAVIAIDGEALLTFGPRTPEALLSLMTSLQQLS